MSPNFPNSRGRHDDLEMGDYNHSTPNPRQLTAAAKDLQVPATYDDAVDQYRMYWAKHQTSELLARTVLAELEKTTESYTTKLSQLRRLGSVNHEKAVETVQQWHESGNLVEVKAFEVLSKNSELQDALADSKEMLAAQKDTNNSLLDSMETQCSNTLQLAALQKERRDKTTANNGCRATQELLDTARKAQQTAERKAARLDKDFHRYKSHFGMLAPNAQVPAPSSNTGNPNGEDTEMSGTAGDGPVNGVASSAINPPGTSTLASAAAPQLINTPTINLHVDNKPVVTTGGAFNASLAHRARPADHGTKCKDCGQSRCPDGHTCDTYTQFVDDVT
ncbi:hypothetical protein NX059_007368 [Plenodomus lindquistii]|nr:hypothetical protein NX059_007368 [Plenodomus lindquistii]